MISFDKVLNQWLSGYPKGQVPIESNARIEALRVLFENAKKEGFAEEYFTNGVKAKITTACINPNHPNRTKRRNWAQYVAKHLEMAFYQVYDGKAKLEENDLLATISEDDVNVSQKQEDLDTPKEKYKKESFEPKIPKIEHFAKENYTPTIDSEFDPEMMDLLGISRK